VLCLGVHTVFVCGLYYWSLVGWVEERGGLFQAIQDSIYPLSDAFRCF